MKNLFGYTMLFLAGFGLFFMIGSMLLNSL